MNSRRLVAKPKVLMKFLSLLMMLLLVLTLSKAFPQSLVTTDNVAFAVKENALVTIHGGVTFGEGTSLSNDGKIEVKKNTGSEGEHWLNNAGTGLLSGTGSVIFASSEEQIIGGEFDTHFYILKIDNTGDGIILTRNAEVEETLFLNDGLVRTERNYLSVTNPTPTSIVGFDHSSTTSSYIVGRLVRAIASNEASYAWPVGNIDTYNLIELQNKNLVGVNRITGSFEALNNHLDEDLNVKESGNKYRQISDQGVWHLDGNNTITSGSFNLKAYTYHFDELMDNTFAILRRDIDSKSGQDWNCGNCGIGNGLNENDGLGRLVSHQYAYRKGLRQLGQVGIGQVEPKQVDLPPSVVVCEENNTISPIDNVFNQFKWSTGEEGSVATLDRNMSKISVVATDHWGFTSTDEADIVTFESPSVQDDLYNTKQNTSKELYVTDNDRFTSASALNIIDRPSNGSIILNGDGSINYTPDTGFAGRDIFSYEICLNSVECGELCDRGEAIIDVLEDNVLIIPQALSPNADGFNDSWVIKGIENYPNNHVTIYNRWGNIVFQSREYDNKNNVWQGLSQSNFNLGKGNLPSGSYYYVLNLGNGDKPLSGYIALVY